MQIILVKRLDGGVSFLVPTNDALSFATIQQIAEKDVDKDLPYWIVDSSVLPQDNTFRDAWEIDESYGDPDGFGGESNEFDEELLKAYRKLKNDSN